MIGLLKDIFGGIITVLKSKYKLIFILFALWIYRIDFIPEDGSGIGKAIQIVSLFGLLAILYRKSPNLFSFSLPTNAYPNSVIIVVIQFCCNKHIMGIHSIVCILLGFPEFSDDNALDMDNVTF